MATAIQSKQKPSRQAEQSKETKDERPIWETVVELGAQISDDEWEKVPEDSSINYKHHLYGAPAKDI